MRVGKILRFGRHEDDAESRRLQPVQREHGADGQQRVRHLAAADVDPARAVRQDRRSVRFLMPITQSRSVRLQAATREVRLKPDTTAVKTALGTRRGIRCARGRAGARPDTRHVPRAGAVRRENCHDGRADDHRRRPSSFATIESPRVSTSAGIPPHSPCARVINLRGRLVIPGMIDTHDHVSYFTARPGYDVRLDSAASIADLQRMIRARAATVDRGAWVTSLGGWSPAHLAEKRMPTSAELDAAAPDHPVLLMIAGQGATNARGKAWLTAHQVAVGDTGALAGPESIAALNALRATMTFEDQKRTVRDLLAYYSSMGVTTHIDNGGPRPPAPAMAGVSRTSDGGLNTLDPATGYLPQLALDREGRLPGRLRVLFYSFDLTPELPLLRSRLDNQMMGFGSDWIRVAGVGERVGGWRRPRRCRMGCERPADAAIRGSRPSCGATRLGAAATLDGARRREATRGSLGARQCRGAARAPSLDAGPRPRHRSAHARSVEGDRRRRVDHRQPVHERGRSSGSADPDDRASAASGPATAATTPRRRRPIRGSTCTRSSREGTTRSG